MRRFLRPGYDLNAAKAAVDRIEQSYAGTDLAGALQLAIAWHGRRTPVRQQEAVHADRWHAQCLGGAQQAER